MARLDDPIDAILALMLAPGVGQGTIAAWLQRFGDAPAAAAARPADLATARGVTLAKARGVRAFLDGLATDAAPLDEEKALIAEHGVTLLPLTDPAYPRQLAQIDDAPALLYVRGSLVDADALAVALVGSRRCSHYGREQADRFAYHLAQAGLTVVSGGAYGVDAAAHRAALRAEGRTIAVIGSGLANPYPGEHRELFDQIVRQGAGVVMSELPMKSPPIPENFPRRNRIISGLSMAVLVVEAARRSGALITARLAVEEHGRDCLALPGRVDSPQAEGCHDLIRKGSATLVTSPADVLDALGDAGRVLKGAVTTTDAGPQAAPTLFEANLTDAQRTVVDALASPRSLDELVAVTALPTHVVQAEVTILEIRGLLRRDAGLIHRRSKSD